MSAVGGRAAQAEDTAVSEGGAEGGTRLPPGAVPALGLFVSILGLAATGTPSPEVVLCAILLVAALGITLLRPSAGLAVAAIVLVGIVLRASTHTGYSDVLAVVAAAVREALAGGNPYGHGYAASNPPGAPFAYGPLALLWYAPSVATPGNLELVVAFAVLGLLALRGRTLGLAVYATTPALVVAATDGSNDTSAGLFLLVALLVAVRLPVAGALLLGVAVAFKPYALAWLPGLLAYGGVVGPLVAFVAATLVAWLPALLLWGAESLAWSFRRADELHAVAYYSLAYGLGGRVDLSPATWQALRYAAGIAVAIVSFLTVRSARSFVIAGAFVFLATLFLGWWSTFAYVAAIAPVICWHLDDWLALDGQRAVWPGDPVGALSDAVDRRWPLRRDWRASVEAV